MALNKKEHPKEKTKLHLRNKHRLRYDFKQLVISCPELSPFIKLNKYNDESIDFSNAEAVKTLNKALLINYYNIKYWDIPAGYLCPPIPGRADYIHHIADVLRNNNYGKIPVGAQIKCLDIGVGANCVYPIIGNNEYGWSFIGTDIDPVAIESANKIIELNNTLKGKVECRIQNNPKDFFYGMIRNDEQFDLSVCNPPFHGSLEEAQSASLRKQNNLNTEKSANPSLNFGGKNNELWYDGGEERFVRKMILQSKKFATSCFFYSSLISKPSTLTSAYRILKQTKAVDVKTIEMGQGNKSSRIIAWTYLSKEEQTNWKNTRWKMD
jgi:23S rRNA (adenine1618-N6)-methyltransferase